MKKMGPPKPEELHGPRWDVACRLGLDDKIRDYGWGVLTARESGRIGGILSGKSRKETALAKKKEQDEPLQQTFGDL